MPRHEDAGHPLSRVPLAPGSRRALDLPPSVRHGMEHLCDRWRMSRVRRALASYPVPRLHRSLATPRLVPRSRRRSGRPWRAQPFPPGLGPLRTCGHSVSRPRTLRGPTTMHVPVSEYPPFHLALPVTDLAGARRFHGDFLAMPRVAPRTPRSMTSRRRLRRADRRSQADARASRQVTAGRFSAALPRRSPRAAD